MNRHSLLERVRESARSPDHFVVSAAIGRCHLALSPAGRVALIAECAALMTTLARTSGALLIAARSRVAFSVDGRTWTAPAVVVECLDDTLLSTFVALAEDVAQSVAGPAPPTQAAVLRAIAGWERLLRARTLLTDERELGLWGELHFLLSAPSLDGAIRAWAPRADSAIDFLNRSVGLEVKTSTSRLRHSVSHQQARSSDADVRIYFASIWAIPDDIGRSLSDLVEAIESTASELLLFEKKLLATGYSARDKAIYNRRFSAGGAILYFSGMDIPRVRDFDAGVTAIRYVIELDELDATSMDDIVDPLRRLCGTAPIT